MTLKHDFYKDIEDGIKTKFDTSAYSENNPGIRIKN